MPTINKSISISAPVEKVFAYVTDPMKLPEWFVGLTEVTDVSGSGVGQHKRWTYSMIGIPFRVGTRITEQVPNQRSVSKQEGGMTSTIVFTFTPHEGGTKLDFDVDYTISVPRLGKRVALKKRRSASRRKSSNS